MLYRLSNTSKRLRVNNVLHHFYIFVKKTAARLFIAFSFNARLNISAAVLSKNFIYDNIYLKYK